MPDGGLRTHRLEGANGADAQDDFLLHASFPVSSVEPRGELAIPRRVFLEVRVEQVQLHASEPDAPDRHEHAPVAQWNGDDARFAVWGHGAVNRRALPRELLVNFLLPAFRRHALVEVPLRIHESHADERDAKIAGFLAVIAGE